MEVIFKEAGWFSPEAVLFRASDVPYVVDDRFRDVLPSSAIIVKDAEQRVKEEIKSENKAPKVKTVGAVEKAQNEKAEAEAEAAKAKRLAALAKARAAKKAKAAKEKAEAEEAQAELEKAEAELAKAEG